MSQIRLLLLLSYLLSYSICQAQENSVKNIITDSLSPKLKESEKLATTVTTSLNSLVKNATSASVNKVDKTQAKVLQIDKKADSTLLALQELPNKYFKKVDKKINKYSNQLTSKTEKTLTKLSRWENKIHKLLQKANPEVDSRLFGPGKITFTTMLAKLKDGKSIVENQKTQFDNYTDRLETSIKYIESKKELLDSGYVKSLNRTSEKVKQLNVDIANTEEMESFVKERKKQLINESIKYIGNSKYIKKINKESFYYVETLRNYKETFSDEKKIEQTASNLLNKIPAFQKFISQNSQLASLFGTPSNYGDLSSLNGLQTRASVNSSIAGRIATGGPNAMQLLQQNMQAAQAELSKLKDKIANLGGNGGTTEDIPGFKPNMQKTRTFFQRIQYGANFQFGKTNNFLPGMADIGASIGYRISDKKTIGIGGSYKLGMGRIDHIRFSNQGISIRSFIDLKLKKQFSITGGYEFNYLQQLSNYKLPGSQNWQQSGLVGIGKSLNTNTKFFKGKKIQLMYDFLNRQHRPVSQPIIFRTDFEF